MRTGVSLHQHRGSGLLNDGLLGKVCRLFSKVSIANTATSSGLVSCNDRLVADIALKPYKFGIGSKCDVL